MLQLAICFMQLTNKLLFNVVALEAIYLFSVIRTPRSRAENQQIKLAW